MPDIACPVCGEINSSEHEFCQHCQSRLNPLTGPLKGADAPIQPGQFPTKKNTAELEPILPQWLRDARDNARKSAEEQASEAAQKTQPQPNASTPDLLAGLQLQGADDEEETPDWLATITGVKPKSKKVEAEPTEVHWVELGKPDDVIQKEEAPASRGITATQLPSRDAPDEGGLPSWLAGTPVEDGETDELTAWLRQADTREQPRANPPAPKAEPAPDAPEAGPVPSEAVLPDWLKQMQADQSAAQALQETPKEQSPLADASSDDDWLKSLQQQSTAQVSPEMPAWLKGDAASLLKESEAEVPAWLKSSAAPPPAEEEPPAQEQFDLGDVPDWLKAAAPQSSVYEEAASPAPAAPETPEWLLSFQSHESGSTPAFAAESPGETAQVPAFTEESVPAANADNLFTELPDWLNAGVREPEAPSFAASAAPKEEAISPGELPSWVQAMRPVETPMTPSSASSDQTLETRGALAGLQGVLPAAPGMEPLSKPKAYSIKLQASEEQRAHAALLEQILAAETAPEPIASIPFLIVQRSLRWLLAGLLLLVLFAVLFLRTGLFTLPAGESNSIKDARITTEGIPEKAPVLVVFDYEPALAGEMEAAAAPLFDHMILLKHPNLTFISTSPTGGLLAERFISRRFDCIQCVSPADFNYESNISYVNLGYLAGGLTGVRAFAENPSTAAPVDINRANAWGSAPLQGVSSLSQFAAILVITDNAESARTWIEQTEAKRGSVPVVMISSAQAAPMIQPYYDSQQVKGIVSGLHGAAIFEQSNPGRTGLARAYWDAYSIGMLLAAALVAVGGIWNLALGIRERKTAEGK